MGDRWQQRGIGSDRQHGDGGLRDARANPVAEQRGNRQRSGRVAAVVMSEVVGHICLRHLRERP